MADFNYFGTDKEKRKEERRPEELFLNIKPLEGIDSEEEISLAIDESNSGLGLISNIPLPIGTRVEIRAGDDFTAIGEIADWRWNPQIDMMRLGVHLVEKSGNWPSEKNR